MHQRLLSRRTLLKAAALSALIPASVPSTTPAHAAALPDRPEPHPSYAAIVGLL